MHEHAHVSIFASPRAGACNDVRVFQELKKHMRVTKKSKVPISDYTCLMNWAADNRLPGSFAECERKNMQMCANASQMYSKCTQM